MRNRQRPARLLQMRSIVTMRSVVGQCVHAHDGRKPFGVLLGVSWLRSGTDDHSGAVCAYASMRPVLWRGRSVVVALTVTTVVLAVAAVVMPALTQ